MTFQSKKVLTGIKKLTNNTAANVSYSCDHNTHLVLDDSDDKFYDYGKYESEIESIISLLVEEGYLEYNLGNKWNFSLTQKGIHKTQLTFHKICSFLLHNSIGILALIVSIIALLTSYGYYVLTPLLDLCKQLLRL